MDVSFSLSRNDCMHSPPGNEFPVQVEDLDSVVESIGDIDLPTLPFDASGFGKQSRETTPVSPGPLQIPIPIENDHTVISGVRDEDIAVLIDVDPFRGLEIQVLCFIGAPAIGAILIEDHDAIIAGIRDRQFRAGKSDIHRRPEPLAAQPGSVEGMDQLALLIEEPDRMIALVSNSDHANLVGIDAVWLMEDARLDPDAACVVV